MKQVLSTLDCMDFSDKLSRKDQLRLTLKSYLCKIPGNGADRNMDKIKKILNRETILYLVFGVVTTVVNYVIFTLFYNIVFQNSNTLWANAIAFAVAVVFAYIVNKLYVFESKSWSMDALKKEIPSFLSARIGSFLIEEVGLVFSEKVLMLGGVVCFAIAGVNVDGIMVAKILLSVVVVILNYVFCKWFVFKH